MKLWQYNFVYLLYICIAIFSCKTTPKDIGLLTFNNKYETKYTEEEISELIYYMKIFDRIKLQNYADNIISENNLNGHDNTTYFSFYNYADKYYNDFFEITDNNKYKSLLYIITVEIGFGFNNIEAFVNDSVKISEIYNEALIVNGNIIGTIRWWKIPEQDIDIFCFYGLDKSNKEHRIITKFELER